MADLAKHPDRQYEGLDPDKLVKAPVSALVGNSAAAAEALAKALVIKTIGDVGRPSSFRWTHVIVAFTRK